jgi:hypothetical protein
LSKIFPRQPRPKKNKTKTNKKQKTNKTKKKTIKKNTNIQKNYKNIKNNKKKATKKICQFLGEIKPKSLINACLGTNNTAVSSRYITSLSFRPV